MQYVQNVATVSITAVGRFHSFRRSGENGVIFYSFRRSRKTVHQRDAGVDRGLSTDVIACGRSRRGVQKSGIRNGTESREMLPLWNVVQV